MTIGQQNTKGETMAATQDKAKEAARLIGRGDKLVSQLSEMVREIEIEMRQMESQLAVMSRLGCSGRDANLILARVLPAMRTLHTFTGNVITQVENLQD